MRDKIAGIEVEKPVDWADYKTFDSIKFKSKRNMSDLDDFGDIAVSFLKVMVFVLLLAVITIPIMLLEGKVISDLWNWFVVPLGVMSLGIAHAIGLGIAFRVLRGMFKNHRQNEDEDGKTGRYFKGLFTGILNLLVLWGIGAIVHSYWM